MYSLRNAVSLTVLKVKNPTREKLEKETGDLKERLNNEIAETKVNEGSILCSNSLEHGTSELCLLLQADRDQLQAAINENASKGEDEINQLREVMLQEKDERKYEVERMDNFLKKENDERNKSFHDVNERISKGIDCVNELREMMLQERDERKDQAVKMDNVFKEVNDERKKNLDDVNERIRDENEKR